MSVSSVSKVNASLHGISTQDFETEIDQNVIGAIRIMIVSLCLMQMLNVTGASCTEFAFDDGNGALFGVGDLAEAWYVKDVLLKRDHSFHMTATLMPIMDRIQVVVDSCLCLRLDSWH